MRPANTITGVCLGRDPLVEMGRVVFVSIRDALQRFSRVFFEETPSSEATNAPTLKGPRDCVLVLDESGSMFDDDWKPSRLEAAKSAAKTFVMRLSEEQLDARVAVVAFGMERKSCVH